ncbi:MAG: ketoacyl-ACP synthase III [Eubacteriales bacterium]|nr:ketoacyl-ACP synthase III [Eubacteriales bacterium]
MPQPRRRIAAIRAIHSYLPRGKLTNEQLAAQYPEWNVEKIFHKTGISTRSVSEEGECASDLGFNAAVKLFESGVVRPEDVDFLLFCTQSPDYFLPTTACLMQNRLGLRTDCGALDYNLGCSGFVYGLSLAKGLIETYQAKNILLVTAETYTKYIHPSDRSVRTIFSDGAAATLVSAIEAETEAIGPFEFGTDGAGADQLIVPAGGFRKPASSETSLEQHVGNGVFRSERNLIMNGPEIFNFTLQKVPHVVKALLDKSSLTMDEISLFVFHQANKYMLERLRNKIGIPQEKFCINMEYYGNTVSSTIPMALEIAWNQGLVQKNTRIMLVGFGVGHSWAATIIKLFGKGLVA